MAHYHGTSSTDDFTGTNHDDYFMLMRGGEDHASGKGGNDVFRLDAALSAGDTFDGGAGDDALHLTGDYSGGFTFGDDALTSVERIRLRGAFDYSLTMDDANVAAGRQLTIQATALAAGHALTFDGSAESNGRFAIFAGAGDDNLTGGARGDRFYLDHGGNDIVHAGGGHDIMTMGNGLTPDDQIDGGDGHDTMTLQGNSYSGGIQFNANTIQNIEKIDLIGADSYFLKMDNGNVAAGERLVIDGSQSSGSTTVWGAETDGGSYTVISGSAFQNTFLAGNGNDIGDFRHAQNGGLINFNGGDGDDTIYFGTNYSGNSHANGGTGNDTAVFDGDYGAVNIKGGSAGIYNTETIKFAAGHHYGTFSDAVTVTNDVSSTSPTGSSSGLTVTYDGSELGFADMLHLDLSGSSAAANIIKGGGASDNLTGNGNDDTFIGGLGRDTMYGGGGHDTYVVNDVSESTSWLYDAPVGIDFDNDKIDLNIGAPAQIDIAFGGGTLNQNSQSEFDSAVEANVGASQLTAGHAVIWTPDDGAYSGLPMLIVDGNNTAGYQAGQDYIFYISGYTGTLDTGDFI